MQDKISRFVLVNFLLGGHSGACRHGTMGKRLTRRHFTAESVSITETHSAPPMPTQHTVEHNICIFY